LVWTAAAAASYLLLSPQAKLVNPREINERDFIGRVR